MTGQLTAWREFAAQGREPRQNPLSPQVEESEAGVPEHLDITGHMHERKESCTERKLQRSAEGPP